MCFHVQSNLNYLDLDYLDLQFKLCDETQSKNMYFIHTHTCRSIVHFIEHWLAYISEILPAISSIGKVWRTRASFWVKTNSSCLQIIVTGPFIPWKINGKLYILLLFLQLQRGGKGVNLSLSKMSAARRSSISTKTWIKSWSFDTTHWYWYFQFSGLSLICIIQPN